MDFAHLALNVARILANGIRRMIRQGQAVQIVAKGCCTFMETSGRSAHALPNKTGWFSPAAVPAWILTNPEHSCVPSVKRHTQAAPPPTPRRPFRSAAAGMLHSLTTGHPVSQG